MSFTLNSLSTTSGSIKIEAFWFWWSGVFLKKTPKGSLPLIPACVKQVYHVGVQQQREKELPIKEGFRKLLCYGCGYFSFLFILSEKFLLPIAGSHCQMLAYIASHRKPIRLCSGAILLLQMRGRPPSLLTAFFFFFCLHIPTLSYPFKESSTITLYSGLSLLQFLIANKLVVVFSWNTPVTSGSTLGLVVLNASLTIENSLDTENLYIWVGESEVFSGVCVCCVI